jgi:hypothetical protein
MSVVTGRTGELRYQGTRVAKCRQFSLDIDREALETTTLGDDDRTYVEGLRGTTGTATILYDESNTATRNLLNSVLDNTGAKSIQLFLNTTTSRSFTVNALLTQVGTPVSVGEVTACSVSFQISGKPTGTF